jgi:hypothetical protein
MLMMPRVSMVISMNRPKAMGWNVYATIPPPPLCPRTSYNKLL